MTLEDMQNAMENDRTISAAPLSDAATGKTEQQKGKRPAVKSGDLTEALAEMRRDPTAVARHHLGAKPQPAAIEAAAPAPAADPDSAPTVEAALPVAGFEPERTDTEEFSAPIQATEGGPVEPAERIEAAPADLVGEIAAVVDSFEPDPVTPAEQPPGHTEEIEPAPAVPVADPVATAGTYQAEPMVQADQPPVHAETVAPTPAAAIDDPVAAAGSCEAEPIDQIEQTPALAEPVEPASALAIDDPAATTGLHQAEGIVGVEQPPAHVETVEPSPQPRADLVAVAAEAPSREKMAPDREAQGFSSRVQRVLNRLRRQQQHGQARQEPTMPVPPPPEIEAVPEPIHDAAADRRPAAPDEPPASGTPEATEGPELSDGIGEAPEAFFDSVPEPIVEPDPKPDPDPDLRPISETVAEAGQSTSIIAYWEELRFGRMLPAWADLDPRRIATCWPNSLLMRYLAESERLQLEPSFAEMVRNNRDDDVEVEPIDYTPMVTEWVIGVGRTAVELGQPTEDTEVFPSMGGQVGYRVVALPLSDDQTAVDHVLCHVSIA